ncbi:MAG: peptide chain release factor N(5)-glutamine methyltransferase [Mangrovibacterium sp.]
MQAGIAYIRQELKDHYPPSEIEGLIRFLFSMWKRYNTTDLILRKGEELTSDDRTYLHAVVERLKKYEPIQYIFGETEFFGLPFRVTPEVLIPRPETEELVHWVLNANVIAEPVIMDACTGSGCIAISLKKHLPAAIVSGCDISGKALRVARENAKLNQVKINFIQMDLLTSFPKGSLEPFDIITSNPPYVTEQEKRTMQQNVTRFEPHTALFVPDHNPLQFYSALIRFGEGHLKTGGRQFWEINESFGKECVELLEKNGYNHIELRRDINGKNRMISGQYTR